MSKCPHCKNELPKPTIEEVMVELKSIPGLMEALGKEAARKYIATQQDTTKEDKS